MLKVGKLVNTDKNGIHLAVCDVLWFWFNLITEITDILAPVKSTVEAIRNRDVDLCTSNAAFSDIFEELFKQTLVGAIV